MTDIQISTIYHHATAILDAPWNSDVHFGCDCGCGGDSYSSEEWEQAGEDEQTAVEFFRGLGIRVMAGEVPA